MRRVFVVLSCFILLMAFGMAGYGQNPTNYQITKDGNDNPIKWKSDQNNKISLKIWLDSLSAEQQRVFKLAMAQWSNFANVDTGLSSTNFAGSDPDPWNLDVMSGEELQRGTSGRNLSQADVDGMKALYEGKTFDVSYMDAEANANCKVRLDANTIFGQGEWSGSGDQITGGLIKFQMEGKIWFFVTDANNDGKITNSDGSPNQEQSDFYSLAKHEIGHMLGFEHTVPAVVVPEPSTLFALVSGVIGLAGFRLRKRQA